MQDSENLVGMGRQGEENTRVWMNLRVKKSSIQLSGNSRAQDITPPRLQICPPQKFNLTDSNIYVQAEVTAFKARGIGEHPLCRNFIVYCKLLEGNKAQPIAVAWRRQFKYAAEILESMEHRMDCRMPWDDGNQHGQGPLHGRFTEEEIAYWFSLVGYVKPAMNQHQRVQIYSQDGQDVGLLVVRWCQNSVEYEPNLRCDQCGKMFINNVALYSHRSEKHGFELPQRQQLQSNFQNILQFQNEPETQDYSNRKPKKDFTARKQQSYSKFGNNGQVNSRAFQQTQLLVKSKDAPNLNKQADSNQLLAFKTSNQTVSNPTFVQPDLESEQTRDFVSSKASDPQRYQIQNNMLHKRQNQSDLEKVQDRRDQAGEKPTKHARKTAPIQNIATQNVSEVGDQKEKAEAKQKQAKKRVGRMAVRGSPKSQSRGFQSRKSGKELSDEMQVIEITKKKINMLEDACWFCMEGEHLNSIQGLGKLLESRKYIRGRGSSEVPRKMKFHYCCAMFSAGGDPRISEDPLVFMEEELVKRWQDSAPNTCSQCGKKYASVACFKGSGCLERHHFPCLRRFGAMGMGDVHFAPLSYVSCCTTEEHEQEFVEQYYQGEISQEFHGLWFEKWYYPEHGTEEQKQEAFQNGRHLQEPIPPGGRWTR